MKYKPHPTHIIAACVIASAGLLVVVGYLTQPSECEQAKEEFRQAEEDYKVAEYQIDSNIRVSNVVEINNRYFKARKEVERVCPKDMK